jgi:hypothetical protein
MLHSGVELHKRIAVLIRPAREKPGSRRRVRHA